MTITLPMDIRIATAGAKLGFVFTRRGIVPEGASAWFLPRIVGVARALEWCMTGRTFQAEEAVSAGLLHSTFPAGALMHAAHEIAREIAENTAPVSVACTRQLIWHGAGLKHPMEAHRMDSRFLFARGRSGDVAEGIASFLEKRVVRFPDQVTRDMPSFEPGWESFPWR